MCLTQHRDRSSTRLQHCHSYRQAQPALPSRPLCGHPQTAITYPAPQYLWGGDPSVLDQQEECKPWGHPQCPPLLLPCLKVRTYNALILFDLKFFYCFSYKNMIQMIWTKGLIIYKVFTAFFSFWVMNVLILFRVIKRNSILQLWKL